MTGKRRQWSRLETEWRERFGEPPPIRTDPRLMRQILHAVRVRSAAEAAS